MPCTSSGVSISGADGGVPQNYDRAIELFKRAALQGGRRAQTMLGVFYENILTVAKDHLEAPRLYTLVAAQEFTLATKAALI